MASSLLSADSFLLLNPVLLLRSALAESFSDFKKLGLFLPKRPLAILGAFLPNFFFFLGGTAGFVLATTTGFST